MSFLPQQNTIVQYVANGIATQFTVPFYTPLEPDGTPDLDVYVQAPNATPIPAADIQEWNVAYTYSPNLDPNTGGIITFTIGHIPTAGYIVTIVRDVSASLDVEFADAQNFSGITLDTALQRLLLIAQQNKSYAFDRNISYIVNSYLPEAALETNTQIPVLQPGYIWIGSGNGVTSAFLEQNPDVSTLRSELANNSPGTDGARLVGYYDSVNVNPTTVDAQLTLLTSAVAAAVPTGVMVEFAGTVAPAGFLLTDGASYLAADYPNLFAVIGYTWGGSGANFNVPLCARRTGVGSGGTATAILGNTVGSVGGSEIESLTDPSQNAAHTHAASTITTSNSRQGNTAGGNPLINITQTSSNVGNIILSLQSVTTISDSGSGAPFNIMQPSYVALKIIKT